MPARRPVPERPKAAGAGPLVVSHHQALGPRRRGKHAITMNHDGFTDAPHDVLRCVSLQYVDDPRFAACRGIQTHQASMRVQVIQLAVVVGAG